jgi:LuxR family quorum-sensing system transcriptional regulator CciR
MQIHDDVQHYVRLARTAGSRAELRELMKELTTSLGFHYFAIIHYVEDPLDAEALHLSSFPDQWAKSAHMRLKAINTSPIHAACRVSAAAFLWSDIPNRIIMSESHTQVMKVVRAHGVGEGFTVPCTLRSGVSGSVTFAMKGDTPVPMSSLPSAQYIGSLAYEASLRISRHGFFPKPLPLPLTTRQIECVILVARGKTDWEIGKILGISRETAHKHIQSAMVRLGVTTRTQLVIRALFDAHVAYSDVMD